MKISITATHVLLAMSMASPIAMAAPIAAEEAPETRDQVQSGTELDSGEWIGRGAGGYPGGMINDNPHGQERSETSGSDDPVRERDLEELDQRGIGNIFNGPSAPWEHKRSLEELINELHQRKLSGEEASASTMSERQAVLTGEPEGKRDEVIAVPGAGSKREEILAAPGLKVKQEDGPPASSSNVNFNQEKGGNDLAEGATKASQTGEKPSSHGKKRRHRKNKKRRHRKNKELGLSPYGDHAEDASHFALSKKPQRSDWAKDASIKAANPVSAHLDVMRRQDVRPSSSDANVNQERGVTDLVEGVSKVSEVGDKLSGHVKKAKKRRNRMKKDKKPYRSPYGDHAEDTSHFTFWKKPRRPDWAKDWTKEDAKKKGPIKATGPGWGNLALPRSQSADDLLPPGPNTKREDIVPPVTAPSKRNDEADELAAPLTKRKGYTCQKKWWFFYNCKKRPGAAGGTEAAPPPEVEAGEHEDEKKKDEEKKKEDEKKKKDKDKKARRDVDAFVPATVSNGKRDEDRSDDTLVKRGNLRCIHWDWMHVHMCKHSHHDDKRDEEVLLSEAPSKRDEEVLLSAAPGKRKDEFLPFPTSSKRDDEPSEDILVERGGKHHKCKKLLGHFYRCKTISFDKRDEAALAALKYVRDNEVNASVPATSGKREDEDIVDAINVSREQRDDVGNSFKSIGCALVGFLPSGCKNAKRGEAAWAAINVGRDDPSIPAFNGKRDEEDVSDASNVSRDEMERRLSPKGWKKLFKKSPAPRRPASMVPVTWPAGWPRRDVLPDDEVTNPSSIDKRGNLRCKNLLIVHWCSKKNKKHH